MRYTKWLGASLIALRMYIPTAFAAEDQCIKRPTYHVGDWMGWYAQGGGMEKQEVISVSGDKLVVSLKGREYEYNADYALKAGWTRQGNRLTAVPNNYRLAFPSNGRMCAGDTWGGDFTWHAAGFSGGEHRTAKAIGWETIQWNGRPIRAMRIEYTHIEDTRWRDRAVTQTCWYHQPAKGLIRCRSDSPSNNFTLKDFGPKGEELAKAE